jgi:acyl-CoA synthetase (AMP-forming)/AMP-acid ligase II
VIRFPKSDAPAIITQEGTCTYNDLGRLVAQVRGERRGKVVVTSAQYTPLAIAQFVALTEEKAILVPLVENDQESLDVSEAEVIVSGTESCSTGRRASHSLYGDLKGRGHPGLVLFSSGSSGKRKGVLHDLATLLEKFEVPRQQLRTIPLFSFDHIGGINTLLYTLFNGGTLVTVDKRDPDTVLEAVARHQVELLPTSPTFLNLLLMSEAYKRHDLSSLKLITYGSEPMPQLVLDRLHAVLPAVRLQQTYGLSELGILRSKSREPGSLWVKVGGDGFETRILDGVFQIKAKSAMLGYLNAPSPFTEDGWLNTGDLVEQDGEYVRFCGRVSEVINVGGEKVLPSQVEAVVEASDEVEQAVAFGVKNPFTGQAVHVKVHSTAGADRAALKSKLRELCAAKLPKYARPVDFVFVDTPLYGDRLKKTRR